MGVEGSMKLRHLLDTVIFVDHLNGIALATAWLGSVPDGQAAISAVTRAEVLVGTDEGDRPSVLSLLGKYPCLPVTVEVADRAAGMRQRHGWKLPGAFQAALAEEHGLRLVTRNTKDFSPEKHAFVLVPYKL